MAQDLYEDLSVEFIPTPTSFKCPLTHDILEDPVATADGQVYERACIEEWFRQGNLTSPLTSMALPTLDLVPNEALRQAIAVYVRLRPDLRRKPVRQRGYEFAVAFWAEELQKKRSKQEEEIRLLKEELEAKDVEIVLLGQTMARRCLDHRDAFDDVVNLSKEQLRARDAEIASLRHHCAQVVDKGDNHQMGQLAHGRDTAMTACLSEGDARISHLKEKLSSDRKKSKLAGPPPDVASLRTSVSMEQITIGNCATAGRCNTASSQKRQGVAGNNVRKGSVFVERSHSTGISHPVAKGTDAIVDDAHGEDSGKGLVDVSRLTSIGKAMAKGRVSLMTPEERVKACSLAAKASRERRMQTSR